MACPNAHDDDAASAAADGALAEIERLQERATTYGRPPSPSPGAHHGDRGIERANEKAALTPQRPPKVVVLPVAYAGRQVEGAVPVSEYSPTMRYYTTAALFPPLPTAGDTTVVDSGSSVTVRGESHSFAARTLSSIPSPDANTHQKAAAPRSSRPIVRNMDSQPLRLPSNRLPPSKGETVRREGRDHVADARSNAVVSLCEIQIVRLEAADMC